MTSNAAQPITWGITKGSMVSNTRRHLIAAEVAPPDGRVTTLCGVKVPSAALRRHPTSPGAITKFWPNSPDETMREPACKRCAAAASRQNFTIEDPYDPD